MKNFLIQFCARKTLKRILSEDPTSENDVKMKKERKLNLKLILSGAFVKLLNEKFF